MVPNIALATRIHNYTKHNSSANLLAGITPTFAGWTTNPGTAANIIDLLTEALTTTGVLAVGTAGSIKYDLGSSKMFLVNMTATLAAAGIARLYISDDDSTYYYMGGDSSATVINRTFIGKARYLRFELYIGAGGNVTSLRLRGVRL